MTVEEQLQHHREWLLSIDSNLDRITASQAVTNEALAVVAQNQASFVAGLASLTHRVDQIAEEHRELIGQVRELAEQLRQVVEQHHRLERLVEQYIRFRGNGEQN